MADTEPQMEDVGAAANDSHTSETQPPEFSYVQTNHFTSEVFKIEIGNIPKYSTASYGEYKRLFKNKLKLNPHKIKLVPKVEKIYVTFKNEADKQAAMLKLENYKYKGRTFYVKNARPKADAMAMKRPTNDENEPHLKEKKRKLLQDSEQVPKCSAAEMVRGSVTKWHDIPYEKQLSRKYDEMKGFLRNCRTRAGKLDLDHEVFVWIMRHRAELDGMCCPLEPILPSPVTVKYRNKSEYTAGLSMDGLKTIGYRVGKYRDKTCAVEETSAIEILPEKMQKVAKEFQEYIRSSGKDTYDPQNYQGHWRQLTVRTTLDGEVMAIIVVMERKEADEDEKTKEIESLKKYFLAEERADLISTLLYHVVPTHRGSSQDNQPAKIIFGSGQITEKLLGLKFQISPDAFFQCNTLAAEVLYSQIAKMIQPDFCDEEKHDNNSTTSINSSSVNNVILFDVCCGTGTIGLTLASKVKHVVGVELNKQAVEDAKRNAKLNGIENAEFHCGKAEDIMPSLVKKFSTDSSMEIIAVADPPRAGLQDKVIQCMRKCSLIKTIIYVSCNPSSIYKNFTDLCRRASKRMPGLPFLPYCAQPVDLFPHTPHCELIIYFKRTISKDSSTEVTSLEVDQTSNTTSGEMKPESPVIDKTPDSTACPSTDAGNEGVQDE